MGDKFGHSREKVCRRRRRDSPELDRRELPRSPDAGLGLRRFADLSPCAARSDEPGHLAFRQRQGAGRVPAGGRRAPAGPAARGARAVAASLVSGTRRRARCSAARPQALLTMLYRSTDSLSRRGAPVVSLTHSASLDSGVEIAPSKPGIKHIATLLLAGRPWGETAEAGGGDRPRPHRLALLAGQSRPAYQQRLFRHHLGYGFRHDCGACRSGGLQRSFRAPVRWL